MSNFTNKSPDYRYLREKKDTRLLFPERQEDIALEARCLKKLADNYPAYRWRVEIPPGQGVVNIFCLDLSSRWGIVWKLSRIYQDPGLHWIMLAGGELLERAKKSWGRWSDDIGSPVIDGVPPGEQSIKGGIII